MPRRRSRLTRWSCAVVVTWALACSESAEPRGSAGAGSAGAGSAGAGSADAGSAGAGSAGAGGADAGSAGAGSAGAGGAGAGGAPPIACDLGSVYPAASVIDPDAPVYQDATWTQPEVEQAFAEAKAQSSPAYRAYRAARDHAEYMPCAFCSCGCASSVGHLSAIDCFKDMHGFA